MAACRRRPLVGLAAGALVALAAAAARAEPVDLQLILAVDCSYSVDGNEYRQQLDGLARALRAPEVVRAIARGPRGAIAVTVVQWASHGLQRVGLGWRRVADAGEAARAAAAIEAMARMPAEGATSVSAVMGHALGHFARGRYRGDRRALDISSDGRHNEGPPLAPMRALLAARGVQVNALAITNEHPTLHLYYAQQVIAGPGAFVVEAKGYGDYRRAIREKLLREIAPPEVAQARPGPVRLAARGRLAPPARPGL